MSNDVLASIRDAAGFDLKALATAGTPEKIELVLPRIVWLRRHNSQGPDAMTLLIERKLTALAHHQHTAEL